MKASEIKVGGVYVAKVSGKLTKVRVDAIRVTQRLKGQYPAYDVTNLATGRKTTFRSAQKFRSKAEAIKDVKKSWEGAQTTSGDRRQDLQEVEQAFEDAQADPTAPPATAPASSEAEQRPDPQTSSGEIPATSTNSTGSSAPGCSGPLTPGFSGLAAVLKRQSEQPQDDAPHLIVEARAGTGKTTTLVCALQVLMCQQPTDAKGRPITPSPQQQAVWDAVALSKGKVRSACFVAFNKSIATELQARVPKGTDAMTMHSMGFRAVTKAFGRLDVNQYVVQDHIADILGRDIRQLKRERLTLVKATEELVGLCKMNLTGDEHGDQYVSELSRLAAHYDVDLNGDRREVFDLVPRVLERCKEPRGRIDYDDMIWLPVVLNLPMTRYDLLLVDEAQDLNRCQQALAKRAGRRLVLCGDPKQAIYGFAGADAESMRRMQHELASDAGIVPGCDNGSRGCLTLPLTVTRRCGKAIVEEARKIVPDFEAHETNSEGKISHARMEMPNAGKTDLPQPGDHQDARKVVNYTDLCRDGDMVLCRVNAPLVSQCFRFLKAGRKANIQGRDVGQGLISTVKKSKAATVEQLVAWLDDWHAKETAKENAKRNPSEQRLIAMQDRHDCLLCFCEGVDSVDAVTRKIESVFTDDKTSPGIKLSSIHKAKGLESRRVFLLQPKGGECPHPMAKSAWQREQEFNLLYVAVTRAIEELVYVS